MGQLPRFERRERLGPADHRLLGFIVEMRARNMDRWRDREVARLLSYKNRKTIIQSRARLEEENYIEVDRLGGQICRYRLHPRIVEAIGMTEKRTGRSRISDRSDRKTDTIRLKSLTPKRQYDLPLTIAAREACESVGLIPLISSPPDQKRKAGEIPVQTRMILPPSSRPSPFGQRLAQGRVDIKALEQDQTDRKARDREQGDVKIAKGQPYPSREVVPVAGSYHENRGRDFSKITGGENKSGLTIEEQGRNQWESQMFAERKRQEFLSKAIR